MRRCLPMLALLIVATVSTAPAQRLTPFNAVFQRTDTPPNTTLASFGAGAGLGIAGLLAGGAAGYALASSCSGHAENYVCFVPAIFLGAAAGGTFGMALGAHLGNRRQGNLAIDCLAGLGVWTIGIVTLVGTSTWKPPATTVLAVAVPVAQLVTTVLVEQA